MESIKKTKKVKLMQWFKNHSMIANKNKNKNKNKTKTRNRNNKNNKRITDINEEIYPDYCIQDDTNSKPALEPHNSLGNNTPTNNIRNKIRSKKPELKFAKSADEQNIKKFKDRKCNKENENSFTEMNASHPCKQMWAELNNNNKCDSSKMACEAASKCMNNNVCGPCKRIQFILDNLTMNITDDNIISNFMSELTGYSHIGLSKDFRHLQIYHTVDKKKKKNNNSNNNNNSVDYSDTKSLVKYIYNSLSKYDININMNMNMNMKREEEEEKEKCSSSSSSSSSSINVLTAVSQYMMELKTKKDFNNKYMKLGLISKGANGKIYAVKSWQKHEFYAMKEICFKNLNINILYEILRNWRMVSTLQLLGDKNETDMFVDSHKSIFLIVQHLYKGSMCELLKETYLKKRRCLNENELKCILKNGIINTLQIMHNNGYIHGDIKPENLVYEYPKINKTQTAEIQTQTQQYITAIIDYDLCTLFNSDNIGVLSEWRGTLGYSAPEWSPYKRIKSFITPKVDIYSLGLTMLILLCGEQPFLCPTAVKLKLEKEDPTINIKQFVYETMLNNGEVMIDHFLNELAPKISNQLLDLLKAMLKHNVQNRADIYYVVNHKWFN